MCVHLCVHICPRLAEGRTVLGVTVSLLQMMFPLSDYELCLETVDSILDLSPLFSPILQPCSDDSVQEEA